MHVDGFVLPVPKKNTQAYLKMARLGAKVWREYGALDYKECIADDVKKGKHTSFPQAVKLKPASLPRWTRRRCLSTASASSGAASR